MEAIIVTNNSKVKQKYDAEYDVEFVDGGLLDVLIAVRDKIHEGHKLLTHPLMGSVKPNETPYKSVLISHDKQDLDLDSLLMISSNVETVQKFMNIKQPTEWKDKILEDFMVIDLDLISSGIESMRQ
ncbi:MAG: GrdX family protein [Natronincolaceae bacterium]|nr:GrdX family protein [Bacillota bacterium]NLK90553.1 GrdX protein [Clostridiales bacterium]